MTQPVSPNTRFIHHTLDTGSIHASTVLYRSTLLIYSRWMICMTSIRLQNFWKPFCMQISGSTTPFPVEDFLTALGKTSKVVTPSPAICVVPHISLDQVSIAAFRTTSAVPWWVDCLSLLRSSLLALSVVPDFSYSSSSSVHPTGIVSNAQSHYHKNSELP